MLYIFLCVEKKVKKHSSISEFGTMFVEQKFKPLKKHLPFSFKLSSSPRNNLLLHILCAWVAKDILLLFLLGNFFCMLFVNQILNINDNVKNLQNHIYIYCHFKRIINWDIKMCCCVQLRMYKWKASALFSLCDVC